MAGEWTCTAEERWVLDTVKSWPGIDATVRWTGGEGWSVGTPSSGMERRDEELASDRARFEAGIAAIYARVAACWDEHREAILAGRCGYSILGSRPSRRPPLLIIGLNPGYSAMDECTPKPVQTAFPEHRYLQDDRYPLKDRLADLLDNEHWRSSLANAVATNFLFFRSRSINSAEPNWRQVPGPLRAELERFCLEQLRSLAELMQPRLTFVLGMKAVDRHLDNKEAVLVDERGGWLIARGSLWGKPAVGIRHPTGARWSASQWTDTKCWFAVNSPSIFVESNAVMT